MTYWAEVAAAVINLAWSIVLWRKGRRLDSYLNQAEAIIERASLHYQRAYDLHETAVMLVHDVHEHRELQ